MYLSTIFEINWYNFISGDTIFTITQYLFWFDSNVKDVALFEKKKTNVMTSLQQSASQSCRSKNAIAEMIFKHFFPSRNGAYEWPLNGRQMYWRESCFQVSQIKQSIMQCICYLSWSIVQK